VLHDDDACRAAYRLHGAELHRFCLRALGDAGAAEDAVQEVFVRAWRAAGRYDPAVASLRTWLFAIARNVVVDAARARSVRPALAAVEGVEPAHGDHADAVLLRLRLEAALAQLSDDHRTAVEALAVQGRTSRDLAAELGISEGTVRSRLFHALRRLRTALTEDLADAPEEAARA
jgi:RNA polymerase sigma-70 factor (ECF subfamily)